MSRTRGRVSCIRCNTCDGHPCLIGAKSDAQTICVDPALEHENVSLITNANVLRLETNGNAREVSKVIVNRNGVREEYSGDIVVVACGAVNSAALLLRSANDSHPNGLANGSDVVGRHYMGHINSVLMALSKCPNPTVFQKTLAINDFYFGSRDWDYPMGHISFVGKLDADTLKAGAPAIAPGWSLDLMAKHSLDFWLTSEDLPDPENRVTVDRDGQIRVSYKLNNVEGHDRLKAQLQKAMKQTQLRRSRARMSSGLVCAKSLPGPASATRGSGAPERHRTFWRRSKDVGTRPQLQSARARQSLRRRCEFLSIEWRSESRAHDHGECVARWRSFVGANEMNRTKLTILGLLLTLGVFVQTTAQYLPTHLPTGARRSIARASPSSSLTIQRLFRLSNRSARSA